MREGVRAGSLFGDTEATEDKHLPRSEQVRGLGGIDPLVGSVKT